MASIPDDMMLNQLAVRLAELERVNRQLAADLSEVRAGRSTPLPMPVDLQKPTIHHDDDMLHTPVSRWGMLRKVLGIAAASAGAGALLEAGRSTAQATALRITHLGQTTFSSNTTTPTVTADNMGTGTALNAINNSGATTITATNSGTGPALSATANSSTTATITSTGGGNALTVNSAEGAGVVASSGGGNNGVYGSSVNANGVYGTSTNGTGVWGFSPNNTATVGSTGGGPTVSGVGGASSGVDGVGTSGMSNNGSNAYGVWGISDSGYGVFCTGNFAATGTKAAIVPFPDGSHRKLYCVESPDSWFEDFGAAILVEGAASVKIDPDFAAVVLNDLYYIFLTPHGDSRGLYVDNQNATGFTVREQQGGASNIAFSYRLVAKRKDVAAPRFEMVTLKAAPPLLSQLSPSTNQ